MKKLSLILIVAILATLTSCNKGIDADDDAITLSGYSILQMDFINGNEGWILASVNGENNVYKLLHSTNGFSDFSVINDATPRFRKLEFIDDKIGFGISWDGGNPFYYTTDGGTTWQNFIMPGEDNIEGTDIVYNDSYFMIPFKKENQSTYLLMAGIHYFNRNDFQFVKDDFFDENGEEVSLYGGASGSDQHYSSLHISSTGRVSFTGITKQIDVIQDEDKSYNACWDNGTTFSLIEISNTNSSPERTLFTSDNVGYYSLKDDSKLYKTTDGGLTWNSIFDFEDTHYKKISFSDDKNGAVICGHELFLTTDGGVSFHTNTSLENASIEEVNYVDNKNIFVSYINTSDGFFDQKLIKITD